MHHLNDDELNLAILGEELPARAADHLGRCVACRRRRDAFLSLVEKAGGGDPDQATRTRVRERALAAWSGSRVTYHWVRWASAAAAVIVLAVLPLLHSRTQAPAKFNAEAVLTEVNQMLDRDPLSAVASEEVVNMVVPVSHDNTVVTVPQDVAERSVS
jgi:hypothetical protein